MGVEAEAAAVAAVAAEASPPPALLPLQELSAPLPHHLQCPLLVAWLLQGLQLLCQAQKLRSLS